MAVKDAACLAATAAAGLVRMAGDAAGEPFGRSLPYRPGRVTRPEVLQRLVEEGAIDTANTQTATIAPVRIDAVHLEDIPAVSSNCQNLVLSLDLPLDLPAGSPLPPSVFVKLPMESFATRWFFTVINAWRLECHFFRHVARQLPIRTPVTYAAASRGTRFYIVQENLRSDAVVQLFTNLDMFNGPTPDTVRACLDTFAQLHAHFHGLDRARRDAILPLELHPFLSRSMGTAARALNKLALRPCMQRYPDAVPEPVADAYRLSMRHWDALLEHWFAGPLSLLHGDSHLGNFFVSGDSMGMLDWQAAHWGKGTRDVQYFLVNSLPSEWLAAHERELLDYYVERRAVHGAPLEPSVAWQEYRGFTFHTLMTIVVSIGFGALNEQQDALMREVLRRAVAAVERVDYRGWLADRGLV